eukprot:1651587-Prymnesium_polylepis.1
MRARPPSCSAAKCFSACALVIAPLKWSATICALSGALCWTRHWWTASSGDVGSGAGVATAAAALPAAFGAVAADVAAFGAAFAGLTTFGAAASALAAGAAGTLAGGAGAADDEATGEGAAA